MLMRFPRVSELFLRADPDSLRIILLRSIRGVSCSVTSCEVSRAVGRPRDCDDGGGRVDLLGVRPFVDGAGNWKSGLVPFADSAARDLRRRVSASDCICLTSSSMSGSAGTRPASSLPFPFPPLDPAGSTPALYFFAGGTWFVPFVLGRGAGGTDGWPEPVRTWSFDEDSCES